MTSLSPQTGNSLSQNGGRSHTADGVYQIIITNTAGAELPEAGGIGTTIFYILGSILVLGSGIYFIARRRIAG